MERMNPTPTMPELTAFDAVTQLIAAAVYLAVGVAALAQAPRDERTRVFSVFGLMNAIGLCIPAAAWGFGVKDVLAFNRVPLAVMLSALSVSAVLLFNFSQVFPSRRPWIRASGVQLPVAYLLTPVVVFLLVKWWPATSSEVTAKFGLIFLLFGFPLMVLLAIVLPVASIVSFLRSLAEAGGPARTLSAEEGTDAAGATVRIPNARPAITGILLSQLAGGALSLLVLGPLHAVAPDSGALVVVGLLVWFLGLLTPLAYAAGIWKHDVLAIGQERSTEVKPD
jgi:hypothetical protein